MNDEGGESPKPGPKVDNVSSDAVVPYVEKKRTKLLGRSKTVSLGVSKVASLDEDSGALLQLQSAPLQSQPTPRGLGSFSSSGDAKERVDSSDAAGSVNFSDAVVPAKRSNKATRGFTSRSATVDVLGGTLESKSALDERNIEKSTSSQTSSDAAKRIADQRRSLFGMPFRGGNEKSAPPKPDQIKRRQSLAPKTAVEEQRKRRMSLAANHSSNFHSIAGEPSGKGSKVRLSEVTPGGQKYGAVKKSPSATRLQPGGPGQQTRAKSSIGIREDDEKDDSEADAFAQKKARFLSNLTASGNDDSDNDDDAASQASAEQNRKRSPVLPGSSTVSTFHREQKTERCEAWLYALPCLKACDETFIEELAPKMIRQVFKERNVIMYESHEVTRLYVLNFGRVNVSIEDFHIGELTQGQFWGEQIVDEESEFSTGTFTAQCVCMTYCLSKREFHEVLKRYPGEVKNFETPPPDEDAQASARERAERDTAAKLRISFHQAKTEQLVSIYTIPMFWDCDTDFLYSINLYLHRQMYFPHQLLMKEGSNGATCIILNRGSVVVTVASRKVAELKDGAVFGELAVLGISETRSATVQAVSLCKVQVLHRVALRAALEKFPAESKRFHKLIESRRPGGLDEKGEAKTHKLRSVAFFKDCSERFLFLLQDKCEERLYIGGQTVVHEGADGDAIYIIIRGQCEAYVQEKVVGQLEEGAVFGEMAALGLTPKTTATVKAKSSCFIQLLHRAVLLHALDLCPEERQMFFRLSNQRLTRTTKRMSLSKPSLESYEFFQNCSSGFLASIRNDVQDKIFLPGQDICTQGFEGSTCFILHQGSAEVIRNDIQLTTYGPGAFFGEFAVLGLTTVREATVKATAVCLVEEITRESLWGVMHDYPAESKIFEDLVGSHLESTVHDAMQKSDFFQSWDKRVVTLLTLHAERKVFAPGQWIVREHFAGDAMFILNRGNATSHMDCQEVGLARAGDYMCATVLLGVHKTYKVGYRARTMCHLVAVTRAEYLKAIQQYQVQKQWLRDMERHEVGLFEREFKKLKSRCKELQIQQRMKRNFGSMLKMNAENPDEVKSPSTEMLTRVFNAWMAIVHAEKAAQWKSRFDRGGTGRISIGKHNSDGKKSLGGRSFQLKRRRFGSEASKSPLGMLPKIDRNSTGSALGEVPQLDAVDGEDALSNKGLPIVPLQNADDTDVTNLLRQLLECSDVKTLYHDPAAEQWHTDYRIFKNVKGPGIPEPPPNPWGPQLAMPLGSSPRVRFVNFNKF
eukprot:gnl/MRDRNA2_/MRDRNA2_118555_c0_seq1.p1 gnl/MRDRNA2_/MRDRNA2_118555_c0~~gnl/MRDRNA2_/MRDRNA2_118555_c0_seq1.p1  ORF type:complete len:1258 (+),score=200.52 gnl/MRDRNA2_/MRDRNA2_118555_c0_seq1:167-3940(+)